MKRISVMLRFLVLMNLLAFSSLAWAASCYTLEEEHARSYHVLVIDTSGSMRGDALRQAKIAAADYVQSMHSKDRAAIIGFGDRYYVAQGMTGNKAQLLRAIQRLDADGQTALNDALVMAANRLLGLKGAKVMLFLTDGKDNASQYTVRDLEQITKTESIFVYGVGLGSVNYSALSQLSRATSGEFETTRQNVALPGIYQRLQQAYYAKRGGQLLQQAAISVRSLPGNQAVTIDGIAVGNTPIKAEELPEGRYPLQVKFSDRLSFNCEIELRNGYRTVINARKADLARDLKLRSRPRGATVFINDQYVGMTPGDASSYLTIPDVPLGRNVIHFKAIPDFDFGLNQQLSVPVNLAKGSTPAELEVSVINPRVLHQQGLSVSLDIEAVKDERRHGAFEEMFNHGKSSKESLSHDPFLEMEQSLSRP